ncbi:shikimate kinase [Qipengyuania sp. DY56-A-20]|jgi:shikimate kinase|uniref:Shikimate kinase n=1 Tax=Qipengyuania benthica TaxID=3067651 RepID=A0ABT9H777_9SPHN|nr:shikimate kinase [Qipengyuania sp. DY56-A-20]MDP4539172.1 shikimate kinase [Qipengyuania sp. DY56-A-20]
MTQTAPSLTQQDIARIARRIDRPIVLVGLMGVGKSTVGRRLANLIGVDFVDVDDEIERAADRSVAEIFEEFGEPYFRNGERRVMGRLIGEKQGVIATGGGAFVDPETRGLIREKAISVWLDCDIETLVERTARRDSRPLLRQGDPHAILLDLKERRSGSYSQADCHVVTDDGPHNATALRILEAIDSWL